MLSLSHQPNKGAVMTTTTTRAQNACLTWIIDPGHSWLAVSLDDEVGFPRAVDYASEYSYIDYSGHNFAGIIYLEEDSDAYGFIHAHKVDFMLVPEHTFNDYDHFVRKLPRYDSEVL
jgi:hypothetical protein